MSFEKIKKGVLGFTSGATTGCVAGVALITGSIFIGGAILAAAPMAAGAGACAIASQAITGGVAFTSAYGATAAVSVGAASAAAGGIGGAVSGVKSKNKKKAVLNGGAVGAACGAVIGGSAAVAAGLVLAATGGGAAGLPPRTALDDDDDDTITTAATSTTTTTTAVSRNTVQTLKRVSTGRKAKLKKITHSMRSNNATPTLNPTANVRDDNNQVTVQIKYKSMNPNLKQQKRAQSTLTNSMTPRNLHTASVAASDPSHAYLVVTDNTTGRKSRHDVFVDDYGAVVLKDTLDKANGYNSAGTGIELIGRGVQMSFGEVHEAIQTMAATKYKDGVDTYDKIDKSCQTFASDAFNAVTGDRSEHLVNKHTIRAYRGVRKLDENKVELGVGATIAATAAMVGQALLGSSECSYESGADDEDDEQGAGKKKKKKSKKKKKNGRTRRRKKKEKNKAEGEQSRE